jgi:hypothetical protein
MSFEDVFRQYENRKRYDRFTLAVLETIPDDQLEQALRDFVAARVRTGQPAQIDRDVADLPPGARAFFYLVTLETEVNNGGYNQYFFNPSGRFAARALESLRLIAAEDVARNLEKAIAVHEEEARDPRLSALYAQRTEEAFFETYQYTRLGECDDEFYALRPQLHAAILRFIRSTPEQFVD